MMRRLAYGMGAMLAFALAIALLLAAGLPNRADYTGQVITDLDGNLRVVAPELNALAPPFERTTLTGETIDLLALRGQPVIINFWATWCAPCRAEMPELQALYDAYAGQGLRILAVNMGESAPIASRWVDDMALTFDILLDPQRDLERLYRVRGQPSTYVIGADGHIEAIFYGPTTAATLERYLTESS